MSRPFLIALPLLALAGMSCRHTAPTPTEAVEADGPFSATPAFPGWIAACGDGSAEACQSLLSSIFFSGRTELLAESRASFTRACQSGLADGCTGAILSGLSEENPVLDAEGLTKACADGSRFACLMQLPMQYQATPDAEALSALIASHAAQCEAEDGVHCSVVSSAYETGTGVEADPVRARTLAWKGCEQQDPTSCYQLGLMLHASATQQEEAPAVTDTPASLPGGSDAPVAPDASAPSPATSEAPSEAPASGSASADRGAGAPEAPAASGTAEAPATAPQERAAPPGSKPQAPGPVGREQEAAAARKAFLDACEGQVGPACVNASHLLFTGFGGDADPEAARLRAWQACELGERNACDLLALTDEGRSYPPRQDVDAAPALLEKYCGLGGPQACTTRGVGLAKAAQDAQRFEEMDAALGWLVKGCEMEGEQACQLLYTIASGSIQACDRDSRPDRCLVAGYVHARAGALPPGLADAIHADAARATESFTRACEGGQKAACAELEATPAATP